MIWIS